MNQSMLHKFTMLKKMFNFAAQQERSMQPWTLSKTHGLFSIKKLDPFKGYFGGQSSLYNSMALPGVLQHK